MLTFRFFFAEFQPPCMSASVVKGGPTAGHRPPRYHFQKILTSHFCIDNSADSTIYANIMHSIYICFDEKWPSDCKSWLHYPSTPKIIVISPRVLIVSTNGKSFHTYVFPKEIILNTSTYQI